MRAFFEAIGYLFTDILFVPLDYIRALELETWYGANLITWIFILICCAATVYWIQQLRIFKSNNEDEQDTTAHSFLS
ncbi:hypothetical protein GCM10007424_17010 [Flavobacterium suaedae]|uniref:Uracil phosphoribosyltransferase n=1 Tax=Flavobacterium suaedae TaxID=1767027 RepID=A0ABQ1JTM4_9FLAO|nr:uracil phosphoribosyltransferase [Flavobacterium suaedae]GGB77544.1 hypothetical protein GCM10007424_17010 [Flavobacterium suaedae]